MKQAQRAIILMATAQTLMELAQGLEVETSLEEITGALHMCGLNATDILENNSLIRAAQIVCREFGSIELTDAEIADLIVSSELVNDDEQISYVTK